MKVSLLILHHKSNIQTFFKQLAGLQGENELSCPPHVHHVHFSTCTQKTLRVHRFSGPMVHRAAGLCSELLSHLLCRHAGYQKETGFFSIGLGNEPCCLWPKRQGFCYTLLLIEKNHRAYRMNRRLNISGETV